MTNFWKSSTGKELTGEAKDSFIQDFSIIPEGTVCQAMIKSFLDVSKQDDQGNISDRFFEITWKIVDGDFKNRQVAQKIKVFYGKPEAIDRNKNMLMLIMKMFGFKPSHSGTPTEEDLASLCGNVASIIISEWEMNIIKRDGSDGTISGNNVREVHVAGSIPTETGTRKEVVSKPSRQSDLETALTRQRQHQASSGLDDLGDDLPF